ncbi:MAG TPA: hypothetical protein VMR89_03895 [Actinomycetota bacterium]|nr:hypothetical protein [Actinomycetota bacterium]
MIDFRPCPFDPRNGRLRALFTLSGRLVLMCDEDGSVWMHPEDVGTRRFHQPTGPDWMIGEGEVLTPGTTRWATEEELDSAGWSAYVHRE